MQIRRRRPPSSPPWHAAHGVIFGDVAAAHENVTRGGFSPTEMLCREDGAPIFAEGQAAFSPGASCATVDADQNVTHTQQPGLHSPHTLQPTIYDASPNTAP